MKCACGGWLDMKVSKFGPFWVCMKCGPVSWRKAMEMNPLAQEKERSWKTQSPKKEDIISWKDL
jgi:hypothetical protein